MDVMYLEHVAQEHVSRTMGPQALMSLVSRNWDPKFLSLGASKILIGNVNSNEAPLDVFMEANQTNYDFPRLHLLLSNFDLLKIKLQEFIELCQFSKGHSGDIGSFSSSNPRSQPI